MPKKSTKTTKVTYKEWLEKLDALVEEAEANGFGMLAQVSEHGMDKSISSDDMSQLVECTQKFCQGNTILVNLWTASLPLIAITALTSLDRNEKFVEDTTVYPFSKLTIQKLASVLSKLCVTSKDRKIMEKIEKLVKRARQ